jgi:hypothetical protein
VSGDQEPATVSSVTLQHCWSGLPAPLHGMTLEVCYRLRSDGAVTRQLTGLRDVLGELVNSRTFAWMNWREEQERGGVQGTGRPVVLLVAGRDDAEAALLSWLESVGLKSEGDD